MEKVLLTACEISSWNPDGDFYGVIGFPVKHSLSPPMHQAALDVMGVSAKYFAFEITPEDFPKMLTVLASKGAKGLNLTVPHKEIVMPHLTTVSEQARLAGAANTLCFPPEGGVSGHNTDGLGFSKAIREEFKLDLRGLRVLVLGAGGAARAVALQCVLEDADEVVVANRTLGKALQIIGQLRKIKKDRRLLGPQEPLKALPLDVDILREVLDHIDLVVNCTSVGLSPGDQSLLPDYCFQPHLLVYDTIYRPLRTPLMVAASRAGARTANGLSMLLHQGALSLESWLSREVPLDVMRSALMTAAAGK